MHTILGIPIYYTLYVFVLHMMVYENVDISRFVRG